MCASHYLRPTTTIRVCVCACAAEDLSITKLGGLTWDQLDARLFAGSAGALLTAAGGAMPLVTTLREGPHPLVFPRDHSVSPVNVKSTSSASSSSSSGGTGASNNGSNSGISMLNNNNNNNTTSNNNNNHHRSGSSAAGDVGGNSSNSMSVSSLHCAELSGCGFACPDCGRTYKLKSSLRNHQKWECGKEPQFQCPYCVYRAKQKMHIGRHMERMHKERYFKMEGDKVIALEDPTTLALDLNQTVWECVPEWVGACWDSEREPTGGSSVGAVTDRDRDRERERERKEHVAWERATCKVGKLPAQPLSHKWKSNYYILGSRHNPYVNIRVSEGWINAINMFIFWIHLSKDTPQTYIRGRDAEFCQG